MSKASNVYTFKNGFCLIVRELEIPPNKDGTPFELLDLPSSPVHVTISSIRTKEISQSVESQCTTIEELISANSDQDHVELLTQGLESDATWMEGTIRMNLLDQNKSTSGSVDNRIIIFERANNEIIALPLKSILSIRGKHLQTKLRKEDTKNCLSINYKNESTTIGQGLMKYLTFGIAWVPSYELNLITPTESNVKMCDVE